MVTQCNKSLRCVRIVSWSQRRDATCQARWCAARNYVDNIIKFNDVLLVLSISEVTDDGCIVTLITKTSQVLKMQLSIEFEVVKAT